MKFRVFWDVAPCSHVEVYRRFRGAYCLHHQGDNVTCRLWYVCETWSLVAKDRCLRRGCGRVFDSKEEEKTFNDEVHNLYRARGPHDRNGKHKV
jgi:hypothetical protein